MPGVCLGFLRALAARSDPESVLTSEKLPETSTGAAHGPCPPAGVSRAFVYEAREVFCVCFGATPAVQCSAGPLPGPALGVSLGGLRDRLGPGVSLGGHVQASVRAPTPPACRLGWPLPSEPWLSLGAAAGVSVLSPGGPRGPKAVPEMPPGCCLSPWPPTPDCTRSALSNHFPLLWTGPRRALAV